MPQSHTSGQWLVQSKQGWNATGATAALCLAAEQELDPEVVVHLHRLGVPMTALALPWMSRGFVGYLPVGVLLVSVHICHSSVKSTFMSGCVLVWLVLLSVHKVHMVSRLQSGIRCRCSWCVGFVMCVMFSLHMLTL